MVFQDPFTTLNPAATHQRADPSRLYATPATFDSWVGCSGEQAERRLREVGIIDASVVDRYPFQLWCDMRQRVGLAAALAADPTVLIADKPATALDVTTQKKILDLLESLRGSRGMTPIFDHPRPARGLLGLPPGGCALRRPAARGDCRGIRWTTISGTRTPSGCSPSPTPDRHIEGVLTHSLSGSLGSRVATVRTEA